VARVRSCCERLVPYSVTAALVLSCVGRQGSEPSPAPPITATASASPEPGPAIVPQAKLVVVIVIDQMRADYYDRLGPQWQRGFKQLREQGRYFSAAYHEHALTETAPGHASISTGTDPARHGIVANGWFDRAAGAKVNAVADPRVSILGLDSATGSSPANLLRESVGDWAQAADPAAIVIAMAVKDRAAILLGGQRPDAALWYEDELGGFTSSSYYTNQAPAWVEAYNASDRAAQLFGEHGWTLSLAETEYGDSRMTTDPKLVTTFYNYALTKQFPHVIETPGKLARNVVRDTPFADQMVLELAREAIAAERMGADEVPDLLLIGLSGGDYAGHRYGPNSVEIHDYYLRIDAALGAFVDHLDSTIGADNYLLVLTSDHGVAPMPEYSDIPTAGRFIAKDQVPPLLARAAKRVGLSRKQTPRIDLAHGLELTFPAAVPEPTRAALRAALAELLREHALVADAWTRDELIGEDQRNEFADPWRRSFHPERSGDVLIQLAPGVATHPAGTGHGTPYQYDQHVPLLIRGPGWSGVDDQRVSTIDLAPTIAGILGVEVGAGVDGRVIERR